jgi:HD-like signal output (HDOD) protein
MIAARCELPEFEDVYLAGLLHDIGIILIDQYEHNTFTQMMINFPQHAGVNLALVEQGRLGYDHTMIGARIAQEWGLSEPLHDAIRYHHQVDRYCGKHTRTLACVDLANLICTLRGWSSIGHKLVAANQWSMQQLELTTTDLQVINDDLTAEIKLNRELMRAGMPGNNE